jgi:hypothetical protein
MHKITLVASAHRESGLCNAEELLKILRAIEPDTIFEESRPSELDSYRPLEVQAITKYRDSKVFQRVPVDRYAIPANFVAETQRVFDCVKQTSQEYLVLDEEHSNTVYRYGFEYLNSSACATVMARLSEIEEKTIIGTRDAELIRGLERWRDAIQRREREMIGNIYEYCRENVFDTGVFLVGAAHKTAIVKEIETHVSTKAVLVNWNFAYDGRIP